MAHGNSGSNSHDPQAGMGRPLPKKEADLFKTVVKYYEGKQYKKGVKAADSILKKFPNHGETLAMKGLTLNCMDKKDEAHELVKKGLTQDMRSHVCWHVFGLLHRSNRKYNDAIKAYKQALRIDPENLQILRDLSLLQIQMRDLSGFVLTRHTILTLKPNNKIHWLAFALAKHLSQDLEGAVSVIDIYLGTLEHDDGQSSSSPPELQRGFESSELALYRNRILSEIPGNEQAALSHLLECRPLVVDESAWLMSAAALYLQLGQHAEAEQTCLSLLKRGSTENYLVHTAYMCSVLRLGPEECRKALKLRATDTVATTVVLTSEQRALLLDKYRTVVLPIDPRSHAAVRIPLTLLEGDALKEAIDAYCRRDLTRGVPFLASDMKSLLLMHNDPDDDGRGIWLAEDPADVRRHPTTQILKDLVDGYIESLTASNDDVHDDNGQSNANKQKAGAFPGQHEEEAPSTILWTWYFRACLHEFCGEYVEGLACVERCLQHTPTAVDVYERKARLLKRCGDIQAAADCLDTGRELDKQDRYINNKTTKYLLRADREAEARNRISLFTVHEGNPEQNLFDMQCTWYELELADCLARKGEWGKSLKKYMAVEKHFEDFHEDQFDFHSYCIRKVTLRAYVDVLRWEDELWSQKTYGRAAEGIIHTYLHLYDNPQDAVIGEIEPDYSSMTPAARKKAKAQQRKKRKAAEKKKEQKEKEEAAAAAAAAANGDSGGKKRPARSAAAVDDDPNGEKLLKRNPLEQAAKYTATLVKNSPKRLKTWILRYDVAVRSGKKLMALQALFKARAIDPTHHYVFSRIFDFALHHSGVAPERCQSEPNSNVKQALLIQRIIKSETAAILENRTVVDFVTERRCTVTQDPLSSLYMRVAVAKATVETKSATLSEIISIITVGGLDGRDVNVKSCREATQFLHTLGEEAADAKNSWIAGVKQRFPLIQNLV